MSSKAYQTLASSINIRISMVPVPNTNVDPVATQYTRMMNTSYVGRNNSRPIESYQPIRIAEEPQYTHEMITQEQQQRQQQQEEEEYRSYTPKDFDKLSPDQLEEAYQKGQQSLESIQSYLASVSEKRSKKRKLLVSQFQQQQQ